MLPLITYYSKIKHKQTDYICFALDYIHFKWDGYKNNLVKPKMQRRIFNSLMVYIFCIIKSVIIDVSQGSFLETCLKGVSSKLPQSDVSSNKAIKWF